MIRPAVPMLPMFALPGTLKLVNVPIDVIFGCEAVVNDALIVVNIPAVAPMLPTLALPVALIVPPVIKFPPVILPVAVINPPVPILPMLAFPVALIVLMLLTGLPEKLVIPVPAGDIIKLPLPAVEIVKSLPVLAPYPSAYIVLATIN